ncbi:hypothetical protein BOX15_Mlig025992g1 [Macrostomum lignano]|uniref:CUB domain-containing protein n=1 Tax=Macrostomum lignano TaxID=282301 RepID=A0A267GPZ4_9PLAT|nr:hypothetical protein BOX15_Mlig025992g1 [Macrostomum lignano]
MTGGGSSTDTDRCQPRTQQQRERRPTQPLWLNLGTALLLALAAMSVFVPGVRSFRCSAHETVYHSNFSSSGELKSPNYGHSSFPKGICFSFVLLTGPTKVIQLRLIEFQIGQENSGCKLEFVDIYVEGSYLRRLCGDKSGSEIRGLSNVTLVLYAEYGNYSALRDRTSNGFRIRYEFQEKGGCGVTRFSSAEQSAGVIKSPGYDGSGYLPLTDCTYDIIGSPNERVVLNFIDIHLAESVLCYQDYISLKNIVQGRPTLLMENACGSAKIGTIISASNWVQLRFHSSQIRWEEYRGFQLKYHFIRIEDLARAENNDPRCGKDFYSGASGVISSPSFQGYPSTVADNVRCAWIIQVPENWQILLTLTKFNFGKAASSCSAANISVFDVFPTASKTPKDRFCASTHYPESIVSEDRMLFIRFFGEAKSLEAQSSFELMFTATLKDHQDSAACPGYLCRGAVQCRDSAGLSCTRLPRYCLHPSARCDGRQSCSHIETSDEEDCVPWHYIAGVATGSVCSAVILGLSAVLICFLCRGRRRRQMRRRQAAADGSTSGASSSGAASTSQPTSPRQQQRQQRHKAFVASNGSTRKKASAAAKSSLTDLEMTSVMSGPAATAAARAEPALKPILKLTFSDDLGHERSLRLASSPVGSPILGVPQPAAGQSQGEPPARFARVSNHYACSVLDPAQPVRYTPAPGNSRLRHAALSPVGPAFPDAAASHSGSAAAEDGYTRKNSYCKIVEEESDHRESDSEGGGSLF